MKKTALKSVGKRRKPTQDRAQETIEIILKTAELILSDQQNLKFSTNELARRAGVSIGSVYQYFDSKMDILDALFQRVLDQDYAILEDCLKSVQNCPTHEYIDAIVDALLIILRRCPKLVERIDQLRGGEDTKLHRDFLARIQDLILISLERRRSSLRQDASLKVLSFVATHAVSGILKRLINDQVIEEEVLKRELKILLGGYVM